MAMITNDWLDAVKPEFSKEYYKDLFLFCDETNIASVLCIRLQMTFLMRSILRLFPK